MLIYHPAYDAFHCVVRLCSILDRVDQLEFDKLRILDFCLCFPGAVSGFKLPKNLLNLRLRSRSVDNPYRSPIGPKNVFDDIEKIQEPSLRCLQGAGIVRVDEADIVMRSSMTLPSDFADRCLRLKNEETFFFEECLPALSAMNFSGVGGLKDRSGLLEYRYDAN